MLLFKRLSKTLILAPKNLVTRSMNFVHHDGTGTPKQHNLYFTPQQKKILFNKKKRLIPTVQLHYSDQLIYPGYDESNILELVQEFQLKKVPLSPTNLCMLIYMFTKYHVMTQKCFDIIQKQAYRLKGEYKVRSIFGGLLGSIIYNQVKLVQFFLGQYELSNQKFTMEEITETLEALVRNNQMQKQKVKEIWNQNFRKDFLDALFTIKIRNSKALTRIFDLMVALEEEDAQIWKRIVHLMKKKHKWSRIPIIERLYSISGKYPEAEALFNAYFKKMAEEQQVVKRYNLTQLRYHTPLEIIKSTQQNPSDYSPKIRTLIPEQENAEEWNAKYQQFLTVGAVKQEEQIIKDKSKSLGFAIRERYENLQADGMDFEKMSKEQFEEMFGDFSETMKTIQFEDARILEMQKQQEQLEAKQAEELESEEGKGKKGKGKKKGNEGEGGQKQKQKKQKSKKKQQ